MNMSMNSFWRTTSLRICAVAVAIGGELVYGQTTTTNPPSNAQRGRRMGPRGSMMVDEGLATTMMARTRPSIRS
jgi:hypothetical protein